jgi:hypothetical protein
LAIAIKSPQPNIKQLTLFGVSEYEPTQSRFGSTVVKNDNLLRGTDEDYLEIPLSKLDNNISEIPLSKPPKLKRCKGLGTGYIIWKETTIIRGKKTYTYNQPWFFWEEWSNGSCQMRSKYIPKKLRDKIIAANAEKLPVTDILKMLL